jgi:aspartyl-tRNA(Asn)/glutamyl-tRNA(Gln) amidotransferase subunit A
MAGEHFEQAFTGEAPMTIRPIALPSRRRLLMTAAASTTISAIGGIALLAAPKISRAQAQAPVTAVLQIRSARDRLEEALVRIADPQGEGARACLTVYSKAARAAADAADERVRVGITLGQLDGAIVCIKDLFDVAGEPTRAGSPLLAEEAKAAASDAPVVRRLRAAGAVIVAKNNMSEFAFTIIGANPHYGTPGNPADRARVPGGSSSGGAVAVADAMCEIAIGSDTGGSVRAPAALCGIVGFKPSKYRVPTDGAFPLSYSLDSIGPIARTVKACADADAVLAGEERRPLGPVSLNELRFGVIEGGPQSGLDGTVAERFGQALTMLGRSGCPLSDQKISLLDELPRVNAKGPLIAAEGFAIHEERLNRSAQSIDPNVRTALERGRAMSSADLVRLQRERARLISEMDLVAEEFDALIMPTTKIVAPLLSESITPEGFAAKTPALAGNTNIVNFLDLCAISLPIPRAAGLPVGLMLVARNGHDRRLLRIASAVERLFAG